MFAKVLVILVLVAGILGGTGYFVYTLMVKPVQLDRAEKLATPEPTPEPTPDPVLAAFAAVEPLLAQPAEVDREALAGFLTTYPDATQATAVRVGLGRLNLAALLSPAPGPDKAPYTVVSGDALVKIANRFKTNAELIYRANKLPNINLRIGQQLVVPQIDTKLVIDRAAKTVTLMNKGEFLATFPVLSFQLPAGIPKGAVETTVSDKFLSRDGKRVAFGDKAFEEAERFVLLAASGAMIRSLPPAPLPPVGNASAPPAATPTPGGIVLSPEDAANVYVLVARGTPVTIQ